MKRGVDENNKGPMFPRLHVNDTEKGGPRAPPRNKMALYEQLSIPSQRHSGAQLPNNPNSAANYPPPPSSSSHGGVNGRGSFFPLHQTPSTHPTEKINNRYSELNNHVIQQEQKKKQEDDDYRVPVFGQQSGINPDCKGNNQSKDNEGLSPFNSAFSGRFANIQRNNSLDLSKSASNESVRGVGYGNSLLPIRDVQVQQEVMRSPVNGDAVSETSMVDSVCGADISPDDVVGVIGQKHFWKARRAIVNQQRLFAVQLFELHRLIKVQKLIAGLPQPMLEDNAYLGKPQKVTPIKKIPIPLEYVLKSSTNAHQPKVKDYLEKSKDDTREFTAENAVEKASLSSVQNSGGPMFSGYPLPASDPRMGLWGPMTQHPPGHQWLIPVMSPSEGLIYKPYYPGPGYMSSGPGPPGSAPMFGHNIVNHGAPPPSQPHYQWPTGFPSMVPPPPHGYFPPYGGMTPMNPTGAEEPNHFNIYMPHQSVSDVPPVAKSQAPNHSEVQVSTASSLNDRTENRDVLPLFPTCPPPEGDVEVEVEVEPSRVIRVVPRNARLANESVARIFQSIQDERKRQDPV